MKLVDIEPYKGKVIASHTYCGVNKLIEVDALEEISEQEIVKPYLDKIRAKIQGYKSTIDNAISEDELKIEGMKEAYSDCLEIIDKYKAESEG